MRPSAPYFAVIFTSLRSEVEDDYISTNDLLMEKAKTYAGFLHQDAVRDGLGIAISYWKDLDSIHQWSKDVDHILAKQRGSKEWYTSYSVRIARVEREYGNPNELWSPLKHTDSEPR
ncbi:MAG: antibiotic biosynthesis monooxygenase [Flavobacteriales bacterium]|nr:antibiotic biosynthesis monooxygenase [Flavobacteriales bacterium]